MKHRLTDLEAAHVDLVRDQLARLLEGARVQERRAADLWRRTLDLIGAAHDLEIAPDAELEPAHGGGLVLAWDDPQPEAEIAPEAEAA